MRGEIGSILLALLAAGFSAAQQSVPPAPAAARLGDAGVTAPEVIPTHFPVEQPRRCRKWDGTAILSAVIGPSGQARDTYFLEPIGDDLDKQALEIVAEDRFEPGAVNGATAAVAVAIEVKMQFCIEPVSTGPNTGQYSSKLRSQPQQTILRLSQVPESAIPIIGLAPNKGVMPPVPLREFPSLPGSGKCGFSIEVDEHGLPQDPKVVKSSDANLCHMALLSVSQCRFRPAMKDGEPVAVRIEIDLE